MGAWGTGLYSDDFALDVKSEFLGAINSLNALESRVLPVPLKAYISCTFLLHSFSCIAISSKLFPIVYL